MTSVKATPVLPGGGGGSDAPGNAPGAPFNWTGTVGDVSTATGNKVTSIPLVAWTAQGGLPVAFALTHNSQAAYSNFNGQKWTYSYLDFVVDNGSTVTFYQDDGGVYNFTQSGSAYTAPAGIHDTLVKSGSNFILTTKDQIVYQFTHAVSSEPHYSFLTSISDENGNTISVTYLSSSSYAVYQIIDPTGRKITLAYDSYGRLSTVKDPLSRTWTLGYDTTSLATCNLTSITFPTVNSTNPQMVFTYGTHVSGGIHYDLHDIVGIQDLRGNSSTYTYTTDGVGSIASETDAAGNRTSFSYSATAPTTTITDANGHTRVDTYDTSGRLVSVQDAEGKSESYTLDSDNNVLTHKDKNGKMWTYTYDTVNANQSAHGNRLSTQDPRNAALGNAPIKYTYTAHNRLQTVTKSSSIKSTLYYDGSDNLTSVVESYTNAGGTSINTATTTIAYPTSPATNYGLPASKTDTNGHKTQYAYDTNGNLISVTTPLGKVTQCAYDVLGFPKQRTDAMNRVTTYTPDGWERLVDTKYPDSSHHTFGYDNNGNLTAFADGLSVTRSYDNDNRMTTESYNGTVEITNTYDGTGQRGLRSTSVHGTQTVSYTYTARNELLTVTDNAGTVTYGTVSGGTTSPGYDPDGNLTNELLPSGATVVKSYDADSSLSGLTNILPGGQGASAFGYGYDLDGRLSGGTDYTGSTPSSLSWTYDGQSHLASESRSGGYGPFSDGFTLDGVGNRSQLTNIYGTFNFLYDADDRLYNYASGGYTFGYNDNGDLTTGTLNGNVSNLTYDYDDQLTGISSAAGSVSYAYDAIGRRVSREDASGISHSFIYDGSALVGEYNQTAGVWDTEYTYGYALLDKQGTSGTEYEFYDGLGDVYQSLNASGGYVLSGEVCDDFGQHFGSSGTLGTDDLSYKWRGASGYRWDNDGLWAGDHNEPIVEVGARYYIPAMGVFLTRDMDLGQRPYEYCNADPVNGVDPSGHDSIDLTSVNGTVIQTDDSGPVNINLSQYNNTGITFSSTTTIINGITVTKTDKETSGGFTSTTTISGTVGPTITFTDTVTAILNDQFTTSFSTLSTVGLKIGTGSGGSLTAGVMGGSKVPITLGITFYLKR